MKEVEIGEPVLAPHRPPHRKTSCSQSSPNANHAARCSAAHAHDGLCPAAATFHTCEAGGDRTDVGMWCMPLPSTHACCRGRRLACGGKRAHRAQRDRARATPPTAQRVRLARCCRRCAGGLHSSAAVEAFSSGPSTRTGAYLGLVPVEEAHRVPCDAEAAREPSRPLRQNSRIV